MNDKTKIDPNTNTSRSLVAMPRTKQEMLARRLNQKASDLNVIVREAFIDNANDPEMIRYLEALNGAEAVTGDLYLDHHKAAERLQELVSPALDTYKVKRLITSLRYALNYYDLSPAQRMAAMEKDAALRSAGEAA
jgi:hypothetical protein